MTRYYPLLLVLMFSCTKPQSTPMTPDGIASVQVPDTLTVNGYYYLTNCHYFLDARLTANGYIRHDDTTEWQACDQENQLFKIETFRFPIPQKTDFLGLRITLNQHLLVCPYHFVTEGFRLFTPQHPDIAAQATQLYAFATPGKQHLQVFFPESDWQQLLSNTDQLELSFQLIPCPQFPAPCAKPQFTLLQGHYDPATDQVTDLVATPDLVNFQNLPDLHADSLSSSHADSLSSSHADSLSSSHADSLSSSVHADSFSSSVQIHLIDSIHTLRIRSIHHLLTEDFALWSNDIDCQPLQNWDLTLIPVTGYNLLEVKIDPPFWECLTAGEEGFNFRIALLH